MYKIKLIMLSLLGYKYFMNDLTKEVHRIDSKLFMCHMTINRKYLTEKQYKELMSSNSQVNGCRNCNKATDNG